MTLQRACNSKKANSKKPGPGGCIINDLQEREDIQVFQKEKQLSDIKFQAKIRYFLLLSLMMLPLVYTFQIVISEFSFGVYLRGFSYQIQDTIEDIEGDIQKLKIRVTVAKNQSQSRDISNRKHNKSYNTHESFLQIRNSPYFKLNQHHSEEQFDQNNNIQTIEIQTSSLSQNSINELGSLIKRTKQIEFAPFYKHYHFTIVFFSIDSNKHNRQKKTKDTKNKIEKLKEVASNLQAFFQKCFTEKFLITGEDFYRFPNISSMFRLHFQLGHLSEIDPNMHAKIKNFWKSCQSGHKDPQIEIDYLEQIMLSLKQTKHGSNCPYKTKECVDKVIHVLMKNDNVGDIQKDTDTKSNKKQSKSATTQSVSTNQQHQQDQKYFFHQLQNTFLTVLTANDANNANDVSKSSSQSTILSPFQMMKSQLLQIILEEIGYSSFLMLQPFYISNQFIEDNDSNNDSYNEHFAANSILQTNSDSLFKATSRQLASKAFFNFLRIQELNYQKSLLQYITKIVSTQHQQSNEIQLKLASFNFRFNIYSPSQDRIIENFLKRVNKIHVCLNQQQQNALTQHNSFNIPNNDDFVYYQKEDHQKQYQDKDSIDNADDANSCLLRSSSLSPIYLQLYQQMSFMHVGKLNFIDTFPLDYKFGALSPILIILLYPALLLVKHLFCNIFY